MKQLYAASPQSETLLKLLENKSSDDVFLQGLLASSGPVLFSSVAQQLSRTVLFVLQDADSASYFYHDLTQLMGQEQVSFFPSSYRRAVKYGQTDQANEVLRTEVLAQLSNHPDQPIFIVTHPEALAQRVINSETVQDQTLVLSVGQEVERNQLNNQLQELGFEQVDYVYEPGQFAIRGSIVDIFSFASEWPFRIDFFDTQIESIRTFELESQLSRDRKDSVKIVSALDQKAGSKISFLQMLPENALLVLKDEAYLKQVVGQIYNEGFLPQVIQQQVEQHDEADSDEIAARFDRRRQLLDVPTLTADLARFKKIHLVQHLKDTHVQLLQFDISAQPLFHKNFSLLSQTLTDYIYKGYRVYILADNPKQQQRLADIFADQQYADADVPERQVHFTSVDKTLHEGFVDHAIKSCFFTDHQIFDRYHKYNLRSDVARAGKMALSMKELHELELGDFLVHIDFGIGKFGGLVRVPKGDSYQEMIRIIYNRGDLIDVSIHGLYKISKYRNGNTDNPPRLSTLGSGAWNRLKERTKNRIKDIARDLILLYARQRQAKGFAYSPDSYLQHELEASFMYEDTPDQLTATREVKADMESERPMDRLVCGDVGFGKTEVAIRAAFKAASDSKQVAVLVPTTVLALQHYHTFSERLKDFPVRVDYISRARTAKQTKELLADLQTGKIDILIGTHKLIGKQVKWKDLGLLIIDEEQKFGVAVKERIRMMKANVDTLTMTATPIPRTLQFSLMGARDMSVIRTAPANRFPIYTELTTMETTVITDAINFEMSRNGQVFFVNARINTLYDMARRIQKHIPDCRIAIGHGQMPPDELERIVVGFINYDYDVLLSTTIVENGIDIPNANTIIINDAHKFGLSDLHQMRGRVGRSNRKAFCYLLAPPKSLLTPEARRRLEALENFSELGSGFNLAMQDLDIRGAGNLLGAEQSGFMEEMGYEMYEKILKEAVVELRNEEPVAKALGQEKVGQTVAGREFVADCVVESDLEMYYPDAYVPTSSERMLLYRELETVETDLALEQYRQRLIDRFGPLPTQAEDLLQVVVLRRLGRQLGFEKIILRNDIMIVQFVSNEQSPYYQSEAFGSVLAFATKNYKQCQMKDLKGRRVMHIQHVQNAQQAVQILRQMSAREGT